MCLLGIAEGVPREDVFSDRCGGGVEERPSIEGYLATAAAMLTSPRLEGQEVVEGAQRGKKTWEGEGSIGQVLCNSNRLANGDGPFPIKERPWRGQETTKVRQERAYHDRAE
jgi:hypothetical protein